MLKDMLAQVVVAVMIALVLMFAILMFGSANAAGQVFTQTVPVIHKDHRVTYIQLVTAKPSPRVLICTPDRTLEYDDKSYNCLADVAGKAQLAFVKRDVRHDQRAKRSDQEARK